MTRIGALGFQGRHGGEPARIIGPSRPAVSLYKTRPEQIRKNLPRTLQLAQVMVRLQSMQISGVFLGMGQEDFERLVRSISMGRLRTYQIFEGFKVRAHLTKLNTETLRKAVPKLWARIESGEDDFAKDMAQAILVSHLDMITEVLDFLGIPHENGFFAKDMDPKPYFTEGWEQRVYEKFHGTHSDALLIFYINHLRWELLGSEDLYRPTSNGNV